MISNVKKALLIFASFSLFISGCAKYVTPGAGVNLSSISDDEIRERMSSTPAASFPANISVARIQASGYSSGSNSSYGNGAYSVVTSRDVEKEADFEKIAKLPQISGVAPLNRILISPQLNSLKDLRLAAATLHTDILIVYTLETSFRITGQEIGPLELISLGFFTNKKANVTTTASAAFFDVRTGYLYGIAEATAQKDQASSNWTTKQAYETARLQTETEAFSKLVDEIKGTWQNIVSQYAKK